MKFLYSFVLLTFTVLITNAQAPQGLNYQGVARNSSGIELPNQSIGIQLSVLDGSASGTALYTETHSLITDANGLFTLTIGMGTPSTGTFNAINWAIGGGKWLKVSMDATGGSSYQLMGTSQLLSVPYALFAGNVTNNGGKQTLVLSDDVTDAQAISIIAAEVGPNTQEIKIVGTTNLTTVDLSMITTAINIEVSNNSALTSLNLSGLTRCDGSLIFQNSPNLSTINISALTKITTGELTFKNIGLTSISIPSLIKCNGYLYIQNNVNLTTINLSNITKLSYLDISHNDALSSMSFSSLTNNSSDNTITYNSLLTSISFPSLTSCLFFSIANNASLTSASFPSLVSTNQFYIQSNVLLNSVNIPVLSTTTSFQVSSNTALASLSAPSLSNAGNGNLSVGFNGLTSVSFPALTVFGGQFSVRSNKLTVTNVNAILNKLVSISGLTGKSIYTDAQNPLAPPSGQGITDKNTLITNGNSVATD